MQKIQFPSGVFYTLKKDITETLFQRGRTAAGYFKKLKRGITFFSLHDEPVFHLVANRHNERFFVSCRKLNGKLLYFHGLSDNTAGILGLDRLGFRERLSLAEKVWTETEAAFNGPRGPEGGNNGPKA